MALCVSLSHRIYMKNQLDYSQRQLVWLTVLLLLLAIKTSAQKRQPLILPLRRDYNSAKQIECPTCGLRNVHGPAGTSVLDCKRFYVKHEIASNLNGEENNLKDINNLSPSFKCKCNYTSVNNKKQCNSKSHEDVYEIGQPEVSGDCLVAHVGMAIRGK